MSQPHFARSRPAARRTAARALLTLACGAILIAADRAAHAPEVASVGARAMAAAADIGGFALTNAYGGEVIDLDSAGGRTVALVGQRLSVLDPAGDAPDPIAVSPPLPGEARAVVVAPDGSVAYVAVGFAGIVVVDVAGTGGTAGAPAEAPIVAQLPAPDLPGPSAGLPAIVDVAVSGSTLFALGTRRLLLYDIARPDRPYELASLAFDAEVYGVAAAGWGAAVVGNPLSSSNHPMFIVSTADRLRPLRAGTIALAGSLAVRLVAGEHAVIASNSSETVRIDVSDLWSPRAQALPLRLTDMDALPSSPERLVAIGKFASEPASARPGLLWLDMSAPAVPRVMATAHLPEGISIVNGLDHVAAVDAADLVAVSEHSTGLARYARGPTDALNVSAVAATVNAVHAAATLDAAHDVVLNGAALLIVRRDDGAIVGQVPDRSARWSHVSATDGWAYAGAAGGALFLTPIDAREPHAPIAHDPLPIAGRRLIDVLAVDGWLAAVSDSTVTLWATSDGGPSTSRFSLAHRISSERRTVALTPTELFLADADSVRALVLSDPSRSRPVFDSSGSDQEVPAILAVDLDWLIVRQTSDRLSAVGIGAAPSPARSISVGARIEHAVVHDDMLYVIGQGFFDASGNGLYQLALAAIDLRSGEVQGITALPSIIGPLRLLPGADGPTLSAISASRGILAWRPGAAPPPTPPAPAPTTTRSVPTSERPTDGRTLFVPYAAVTRPATKPRLTLEPVARLGGTADSVVVDGGVAWLRERGALTAVDIDAIPPRPLGNVTVCEPDRCDDNAFAASGGRVALDDGAGGVTFVDVTDPRRPRVGGRFTSDTNVHDEYEVLAPWPGTPMFLVQGVHFITNAAFNELATEIALVDASDADAPRVVRTLQLPDIAFRLTPGTDGVVYFVGATVAQDRMIGELQVWRLTTRGEREVIGRLPIDDEDVLWAFEERSTLLVRAGKQLVLALPNAQEVHVYDVSDPARPRAVAPPDVAGAFSAGGVIPNPGMHVSLQAIGDRLIWSFPRLRALVSSGIAPEKAPAVQFEVPTLHLDDVIWATRSQVMTPAGDRLIVAGGAFGGLSVIRGLASGAPSITTMPGLGSVRGVAVAAGDDRSLLVSGGSVDVLHRVDLADPSVVQTSESAIADPMDRQITDWDWMSAVEIAADGVGAWVAEAKVGLAGFELGAADAPHAVPGSARDDGDSTRRLAIARHGRDPFAMTVHPVRGLEAWDISSPSGPPQRVVRWSTGGAPEDIAVIGPHAFIADGPGGVLVVDVRSMASPREAGRLRLPGSAVRIAADASRALLWVALERRSNSTAPLSGVAGGREPSALVAVDVANPARPRLSGVLGLDATWIRDIALGDDIVFVSGFIARPNDRPIDRPENPATIVLYALDANPGSPTVLGRWTDRPYARATGGLAVMADGRVVLAAGEDGVRVFRAAASGR